MSNSIYIYMYIVHNYTHKKHMYLYMPFVDIKWTILRYIHMDAVLPVTSNPLWLVWNILKQSLDDLAIQDFPVAMFVWVMAHCNRWEIYISNIIQSYIHTYPKTIFHGISTEILWVALPRRDIPHDLIATLWLCQNSNWKWPSRNSGFSH